MSRIVFSILLLTLVYALTLASFAPWDLALGVLLAGGTLLLFRRFLFPDGASRADQPGLPIRLARFPLYAAAVVWDITRGTWMVTAIVLGLRPLRRPGIVTVPIGERTRLGAVVSCIATTLSPGTVAIDIDWDRETMLIHVLDASDPDALRADLQHMYDRYQRHVFP